MAFVVTEACIRCKYTDCVTVCPVDCFHEGVNMLVIDPDECIDCGACVPECPIEAIVEGDEPAGKKWAALNRDHAKRWPVLTEKKRPSPDAEAMKDEPDKYRRFFNPTAG